MEMHLIHEIKELYKVKTPRHIVFGDPLYYEEYTGKELDRLVINYKPPQFFEAKLALRERKYKEFDGSIFFAMVLYLGPPELLDVYAQDKYYKSQVIEEKEIGLDSGRYYLEIDMMGREVDLSADDHCGQLDKYVSIDEGKRLVLGATLTIEMPDEYTFQDLKEMAGFYFPDMEFIERTVERPSHPEKDESVR